MSNVASSHVISGIT